MKKINLLPVVLFFISIVISSGQPESHDKFGPANKINSGVNIHFTKGHERDLDMIAEAGFKFIRMDFTWQSTEREKGVYDWSAYEELTENLNKRGIRALYILDYSNPLYEDKVESKDPLSGQIQKGIAAPRKPESIEAFAKWASAAVKHFRGNNIIWEIWNEPNIFFWRPVPDVENYNKLALATCKAVKAAVPEAIIIGPATSQLPVPFIESFLASGVIEYIDAVSVHPYRRYSMSPETAVDDYKKIDELIKKYTPVGKSLIPVISGEWGYNTSVRGVSLETQAAYIVRMQLSNLVYGIPLSIWYDWKNDGPDPDEWEHNFGTVTPDLDPKPAYVAIKTLNEQLGNFTFLKRIEIKNPNDFVMLFRDEKGNGKIAAWTTEVPHNVIVEGIKTTLGTFMGTDWSGKTVHVKSDDGALLIEMNVFPHYITLPAGWK
jgi:beta-xylosidase